LPERVWIIVRIGITSGACRNLNNIHVIRSTATNLSVWRALEWRLRHYHMSMSFRKID
jgi:hypothetical protein